MELAGFYEGNKEITPSVKIKQSTPKWIASSSRWLPWRDQEMKELWVLCAEKKTRNYVAASAIIINGLVNPPFLEATA